MLVRLKQSPIGVAFIAALIVSASASAANNQEGQKNADLILKIQAMQTEISSLRNELERQGYQLNKLQKSSASKAVKLNPSNNLVSKPKVVFNDTSDLGEVGSADLSTTKNTSQIESLAQQEESILLGSAEAGSVPKIQQQVGTPELIDFPVSPKSIKDEGVNEISSGIVGTNAVSSATESLNTQTTNSSREAEILEKGDSSIKTDLKELDLYNKGIEKLNAEEYKAASSIFSSQIQNFPKGQKTADAYYWLAESFFIMGDYESAAKSYQALGTLFPVHPRTPKALMKAVAALQESGQTESAKITLLMLIKNYPSSSEVSEAKQKYSSLL